MCRYTTCLRECTVPCQHAFGIRFFESAELNCADQPMCKLTKLTMKMPLIAFRALLALMLIGAAEARAASVPLANPVIFVTQVPIPTEVSNPTPVTTTLRDKLGLPKKRLGYFFFDSM